MVFQLNDLKIEYGFYLGYNFQDSINLNKERFSLCNSIGSCNKNVEKLKYFPLKNSDTLKVACN